MTLDQTQPPVMRHMNANMAALSFSETLIALILAFLLVVIIAVLAVYMLRPLMNRPQPSVDPILSGQVSLVFKDGHCTRIVDDGMDCQLANGETRVPLSLQDHGFPLEPLPCYTADRARVRLTAYAVWSVCNVRDLLRSASIAEESLRATVQMAVQPALAEAVANFKLEELTQKMGEIARMTQKEADTWLKRYGLSLHKVAITYILLPDPPPAGKPEGQKEAERLTTLNGVVPKVDDKTLHYARQLRELELANAKEARAEKKV